MGMNPISIPFKEGMVSVNFTKNLTTLYRIDEK